MLNVIWLFMILVAVLVGGFTGRLDALTSGAFDMAKFAVMDIALPLIGLMAIWMGMMRLAERSGLVQLLARALRPAMRRLFPDVPVEHPAQGAMVLNMAANMLGLGNAATPLGLRAMALLQKLNPHPTVASNAMVTFLAVNTASIQLVPTTAISIMAVQASNQGVASGHAASIVLPALITTVIAMACGIFMAKALSNTRAFRIPADEPRVDLDAGAGAISAEPEETPEPARLTAWGRAFLFLFFGAFVAMFIILVWPQAANALPRAFGWGWGYADLWPGIEEWMRVLRAISTLAVPFLLSFFPLYAWLRGVPVYAQFCEGAKDAFGTAQRIIPFLVAMLIAIRMLREAGVIQMITSVLQPALNFVGFPADLLPLALMRPLSGSASQGLFVDVVATHGADSLIAKMAATIYGSTETTFYVLAVYFGSVGIRKTRHAVLAGLTADVVAIFMAIAVCRWLLG
jgi:spore maturation protein SpmA